MLLSSPFVGYSRHTAILDIFAAGGRFAAASLDECNCGNSNGAGGGLCLWERCNRNPLPQLLTP